MRSKRIFWTLFAGLSAGFAIMCWLVVFIEVRLLIIEGETWDPLFFLLSIMSTVTFIRAMNLRRASPTPEGAGDD